MIAFLVLSKSCVGQAEASSETDSSGNRSNGTPADARVQCRQPSIQAHPLSLCLPDMCESATAFRTCSQVLAACSRCSARNLKAQGLANLSWAFASTTTFSAPFAHALGVQVWGFYLTARASKFHGCSRGHEIKWIRMNATLIS